MNGARPAPPAKPGTFFLPVTVFSTLALAFAAAGLSGVIYGWSWYLPVLVCLLATGAATAGTRFLTTASWAPRLAGAVLLGLTLTALFLSDTAVLGFIPTGRSWGGFWALLAQSQDTIQHEVVPANPRPGITYLIAASLGVLALVTDWLIFRARVPLAAAGPLLAVLLVPAFLTYTSVGAWQFSGTALCYAMTLASARRAFRSLERRIALEAAERNTADDGARRGSPRNGQASGGQASSGLGRAWVLGTGAVVLTLVVSALTPGFTDGLFPQGSRLGSLGRTNGLNPLLSLNSNLRQTGSGTVISLFTNAPSAPYLRLTTIDSFNGARWEPENRDNALVGDPSRIGLLDPVPENTRRDVTEIHSGDFSSPYLLAPPDTFSVVRTQGNWRWDPENLTIKSPAGSTSAGENYTAYSFTPQWTPDQLRALSTVPSPPGPNRLVPQGLLDLPPSVPAIVRNTEQSVTRGADTPFDKALAIERYLRGTDFSYSITAPVDKGYDGTGMDVLAQFLKAKSGYCIHYSTAMAVMARLAGIPSRVAVGFAPGQPTGAVRDQNPPFPALTEYSVSAKDAHAWPELYLGGAGWVRFEPTPSRGVVPAYAFDPLASGPSTGIQEELHPRDSATPVPSASTASPTATPVTQGGQRPAEWWEGLDWQELAWGLGGLLLLLMLSATPRGLRSLQRRRRLSASQPESALRIGAMEELLATAADHGVRARPSETPRVFGARLAEPLSAGGRAAVQELVRDYEQTRYGAPGNDPPGETASGASSAAARLAVVGEELRSAEDRAGRFRARWLPPSLFRRG